MMPQIAWRLRRPYQNQRPHLTARNTPNLIAVLAATVLATAGLMFAGAGCRGSFRDRKHSRLLTQSDVNAYVTQIQNDPSPDIRRHAINRVAETSHVDDPAVLQALNAAATTDQSATVRTAAILALGHVNEPVACQTCLEVLEVPPGPPGQRDANAGARAGAIENLHACACHGGIPEALRPRVVATACRLLHDDPERNVRVGAARLLGYFPERKVLDALVDALKQRDFGICYEAERSLMRQTGHTFDHDAQAWRKFLEDSDDPWADRGALNDQLDPPKRKWYQLRMKKN